MTPSQESAKKSAISPEWEQCIRAQLEHLVSSRGLHIPARRARLLRYLVERTLSGEAEEISEYAIALDVFGRPTSFDPKTDAVVRAEVGRLRRDLTDYYAARNGDDPVAIVLPARSYVPTFAMRTRARKKFQRWYFAAGLSAVLAAGTMAAWLLLRPAIPAPEFSLAVLPVAIASGAGQNSSLSPDLGEVYYGPLARTAGLSLIDWGVMNSFRGPDALARARKSVPASMILQTVIDGRGGSLNAALALLKSSDASVIWKENFPLPDPANPDRALVTAVADGLKPFLELTYNQYLFQVRNNLVTPQNPCSQMSLLPSSLRTKARFQILQEVLDARGYDSRIPYTLGGQSVSSGSSISVPARTPLTVQAPPITQLSQDTCVLVSEEGNIPLYENGCLVPDKGANVLRFHYQCARSAYPIDLRPLANSQQLWNEDRVPSGARILSGIPFLLAAGKYMEWKGDTAAAGTGRPAMLVIPVNRRGVSRAYFLLNTEWGQSGPASYLSLEFSGDQGAHFVKPLIGGVDVRDYHHGIYVNTINGTTSRLAYRLTNADVIDMVEVDLPDAFRNQSLDSITLHDTGRHNFERAILRAVTVL